LKIEKNTAHHFAIFTRLIILGLSLTVAGDFLCAQTSDVTALRSQLDEAVAAEDKPAIIELSRRIIATEATNQNAWEHLLRAQIDLGDLDRADSSLEEWTRSANKAPSAIDDFRGDILVRRKDYPNAEKAWLAFLAKKPGRKDAAAMYQKLADINRTQEHWDKVRDYLTKSIAAEDSAGRRVELALALLHLRQWDAAFAEINKASRMDASDAAVKDALPRYERLKPSLPQLKAMDAQLARVLNDVGLLLDRARILTMADLPGVALDDCRSAMSFQPKWIRPRIQTADALLAASRPDDAVAIGVSRKLTRTQDGHVSDPVLRELAAADTAISENPSSAQALVNRSKILRALEQFTLALADANAALAINDQLGPAHCEAALSLAELDQTKEAADHAVRATELEPNNAGIWFVRGKVESERADFATAVSSLTRSIEIQETVAALQEREKAARRLGQNDRADADLARIQQLQPPKK
jgi:tetratricopeptide (TPR) repeat protein